MELLFFILFCWLFFKALGLTFRVAWGAAKFAAAIFLSLAVVLLFVCTVFAGGLLLLLPLVPMAVAFGLLKLCTG